MNFKICKLFEILLIVQNVGGFAINAVCQFGIVGLKRALRRNY